MSLYGLGLGVGTQNSRGEWLETYFPAPLLAPDAALVSKVSGIVDLNGAQGTVALEQAQLDQLADVLPNCSALKGSKRRGALVALSSDSEPASVPEAYFKLHLLSHRLVKPHGTNLAGLFKCLPNVAWTSAGAIDLDDLTQLQSQARAAGENLHVYSVDKFPAMTNYVVPKGVRIGDGARVRLGAYIGEGTTIMHEGFVNFNAGCSGPNMIEGRISAGVMVGEGSDLGGGCSTMGTLSGGNDVVISIGKNCLLGANAGCGIPLGDSCTIEAGLYLTAGAKVEVYDGKGEHRGTRKAADFSQQSGLLFRRNSVSGAIECRPNPKAIELNEELHANN